MTEQEWQASVNAQKMIAALRGKGSERLWRLFAVACARRVEVLLRYPESRKALDVAERFADGAATVEELTAARTQAKAAARQAHYDEYMDEIRANFGWDAEYEAVCAAMRAAEAAVQCVAEDIGKNPGGERSVIAESLQLPDLLREIFGSPFQWTTIDPAWLAWNDGAARKLAQMIYDNRAFDSLPILADALGEAGCTDAAILEHLRGPGLHVRGCWCLDLLLDKG
jgi:hypothetical protein